MEELKMYVLDELRVVTYKWLSATTSVSADTAKRCLLLDLCSLFAFTFNSSISSYVNCKLTLLVGRMLYQFVDENSGLKLRINYLVSGWKICTGSCI